MAFISIKEFAEKAGISQQAVYQSKKLQPYIKKTNKGKIISEDAFIIYSDSRLEDEKIENSDPSVKVEQGFNRPKKTNRNDLKLIDFLYEQIKTKDDQIKMMNDQLTAKDNQIDALNNMVNEIMSQNRMQLQATINSQILLKEKSDVINADAEVVEDVADAAPEASEPDPPTEPQQKEPEQPQQKKKRFFGIF